MVLGGAGGLLAGAALGHSDPPAGTVAMASQGGYWGTWFGGVGAVLGDLDGDAALATMLVAGDVGLLAGARAAPKNVTPGQVWAASALGIAGVAAGFGLDLIAQPSDGKTIIAIPAALGAIGLGYGWSTMIENSRRTNASGASRFRFGMGLPQPAPVLSGVRADGRPVYRTAIRVPLLEASF